MTRRLGRQRVTRATGHKKTILKAGQKIKFYGQLQVLRSKGDSPFESIRHLCNHYGVNYNFPRDLEKQLDQKGSFEVAKGRGAKLKIEGPLLKKFEAFIRRKRNSTATALAKHCGVSIATVIRARNRLGYKPTRQTIKPLLNKHHKAARLEYAHLHINDNHDRRYEVDMDESWKFVGGGDRPHWYKDGEERKISQRERKHHPEQVMFLAVVGNARGKGAKIMLHEFTETHILQRGNKRTGSKKGDKRKQNKKVNAAVYASALRKAHKAIRAHPYFKDARQPIWNQEDNCKAHIAKVVGAVRDAAETMTPKIKSQKQAARSPETNVCDMSLFTWMQQYVDQKEPTDRKSLCRAVRAAWKALPEEQIVRTFKHKNKVCQLIIEHKGNNGFEY